jgi:AhpD family alkylhydroperoxidase
MDRCTGAVAGACTGAIAGACITIRRRRFNAPAESGSSELRVAGYEACEPCMAPHESEGRAERGSPERRLAGTPFPTASVASRGLMRPGNEADPTRPSVNHSRDWSRGRGNQIGVNASVDAIERVARAIAASRRSKRPKPHSSQKSPDGQLVAGTQGRRDDGWRVALPEIVVAPFGQARSWALASLIERRGRG